MSDHNGAWYCFWLAFVLVAYVAYWSETDECARRRCPAGERPAMVRVGLVSYGCLCAGVPR